MQSNVVAEAALTRNEWPRLESQTTDAVFQFDAA